MQGRVIVYETAPSFIVILNRFQDPFLVTSEGFWGTMDAEPKASAAE
ncbi:hypothetical protein EBBID32_21490 [Sphingobium indicum BiD32]|uniref:Uncharacterized protein n=1 Tax=Sphingobium indicum BiD32 TaxID=1301087 RepID=N1MKP2_9SPHN|nr:hypothetical protein EBBID32_21490 [Sphingobium indicum BiD32]